MCVCVCICANALLAPFHPVPGPNFKSYLARASALGCAVVHAVVCCKQPFTISLSDVSQSLVSVFIDKLAMRSYSSLQMDEMNVNGISLCMFVLDFSDCFVKNRMRPPDSIFANTGRMLKGKCHGSKWNFKDAVKKLTV